MCPFELVSNNKTFLSATFHSFFSFHEKILASLSQKMCRSLSLLAHSIITICHSLSSPMADGKQAPKWLREIGNPPSTATPAAVSPDNDHTVYDNDDDRDIIKIPTVQRLFRDDDEDVYRTLATPAPRAETLMLKGNRCPTQNSPKTSYSPPAHHLPPTAVVT